MLAAYASRNGHVFNMTNVTLCVPVAMPAIIAHAYPSAAISLAFGAIGGWNIWREDS